tara:strand:- start:956 stop:1066 length:111 start_codon:yes stop_codon:yes gene_type:complete
MGSFRKQGEQHFSTSSAASGWIGPVVYQVRRPVLGV